ncbi:hypothetical protein JCM10295v2_000948 [Rhodotorula toruloides]
MQRFTHAFAGDYDLIELASKVLLPHREIRVEGVVRGVIEEEKRARTKGVPDAQVKEVKRLTESGTRAILPRHEGDEYDPRRRDYLLD